MSRALGVAALGAAMLAGALAFGASSLYLPSVALLVLAGGAAAWVTLAAAGAAIERTGGPSTVEEEQAWPLRLELRRGIVRPPGGELTESLLDAPLALRRGDRRVRIDVRFERRGEHSLAPARVTIRDPLGLARRELRSAPLEVLVLPRIEPVLAPRGGGSSGAGHVARAALDTTELEPDALRPYRPGAPATRIHWPAVARTGEMIERRLAADSSSRPLVVLDTRGSPTHTALDSAVRAAASLCVHLARGGGCAVLLPGDRRSTELDPDMRAWHPLHVRLALVAPGAAPAAGRLERGGEIYWVAPSAASVPVGLGRAAAAERWLVTPLDGPAGDGSAITGAEFLVAGCAGRAVGRRPARRAA
jgi:uncharacterized protein (DUF58 family)